MSLRKSGFTLVEILVVITIIVVLIAILIPMLGRAQEAGRRTVCLANIRELTGAWIAYSADHEGQLVASNTGAGNWVLSGNTDASITGGLLWPYTNKVDIYACHNQNPNHERTYSINCYLNGQNYGAAPIAFMRLIRKPAETFVFIEEFDTRQDYNLKAFALNGTGDLWTDCPSHFHGDGCSLSFADGSAKYWRFADPRTLTIGYRSVTPKNPDLKYLQSIDGY